ncbi:MAG: glycosyltransferase [Lachnospiraceae bacterium]|nr:glycosyltransferase [Lachnospiraceae bacterium]
MEKKYKVLIVHNYYQIPGGEDTVVANEKKLLEDHGHTVVFYSRNNSELKVMSLVQKLSLPFATIFNFRTYREVKKIIREQHIDIVHVHNTLSLISPSVYYAAFSCKVPVVQTIHNFRLLCPGALFYREGHICEDCVKNGLLCAVKHGCYRGSKLQTLICVTNTKIHRMLGTYRKLNYICLTEFNKEKLLQLNRPGKKQIINPAQIYIKPNFTFETCIKQGKETER